MGSIFARYGMQDEDISQFGWVFTVGGQIIGNLWRRSNDVIGIAYGASRVTDNFQDATSRGLLPDVGYVANVAFEHYLEVYYRYWANKNLTISPDIQYVINPGGDGDKDNIFIVGGRMQLTF